MFTDANVSIVMNVAGVVKTIVMETIKRREEGEDIFQRLNFVLGGLKWFYFSLSTALDPSQFNNKIYTNIKAKSRAEAKYGNQFESFEQNRHVLRWVLYPKIFPLLSSTFPHH